MCNGRWLCGTGVTFPHTFIGCDRLSATCSGPGLLSPIDQQAFNRSFLSTKRGQFNLTKDGVQSMPQFSWNVYTSVCHSG